MACTIKLFVAVIYKTFTATMEQHIFALSFIIEGTTEKVCKLFALALLKFSDRSS
jgi:hypothetical protein